MNRSSRWPRATFLAALPLLLLAATWAPLLQTPPQFDSQQFRVNEDRWRALPEASRQELRRKWQAFSALPDADRAQYAQSMDILRRMTSVLRRILGREPRAGELELQLTQAQEPVHAWLAEELQLDAAVDEATLRGTAERVLGNRIAGYLDRLVADGRLTASERGRILAQPLSLIIREAHGLHASQQQRGGDEMSVRDGGVGTDDYSASLRASEREALEDSRSPAGRGPRQRGSEEPLRLRLYKLAFIVEQLRAAGMSPTEIQDAVMLPMVELERVAAEQLGSRQAPR